MLITLSFLSDSLPQNVCIPRMGHLSRTVENPQNPWDPWDLRQRLPGGGCRRFIGHPQTSGQAGTHDRNRLPPPHTVCQLAGKVPWIYRELVEVNPHYLNPLLSSQPHPYHLNLILTISTSSLSSQPHPYHPNPILITLILFSLGETPLPLLHVE